MATKIPINNIPLAKDLWKGIGGHFDAFDQILCEFLDNSVSNFVGNSLLSKTIIVTLIEKPKKRVQVSIEDSGTGIKDLDAAFSLGNRSAAESPLNEHGFGLKHALASANSENNAWKICTRTKTDYDNQSFKKIESAYDITNYGATHVTIKEENWPGELNGSGTHIQFDCSWDLFYTLRKGISGNTSPFSTLTEILAEDLGFIYAGLIQENKATITIQAVDLGGTKTQRAVVSIQPNWKQTFQPGQGTETADLGGGAVKIKYCFGAMNAAQTYKYYRKNMSSSGLEIRLNGRVLAYNLFKEVWGIERHNWYNHLLVTVDVISPKTDALPSTRTSKNGLREGDPRLEKLLEWVRLKMPSPNKEIEGAHDEADLFNELEKSKNIHLPNPKTVVREQNVYKGIKAKIPVDLYVHYQDKVIIYEGKKDESSVKDVYQLKMYWDGCVLDALQPTQGILIAAKHPQSVLDLVNHVNKMKDIGGKSYVFTPKTWKDEGIPYPN